MTPLTAVTPFMVMPIVSASARSDLAAKIVAAVSEVGPAQVPQKKIGITLYFPSSFGRPQMSLNSNSNDKIVV
jgi:hypothetical protein